MNSLSELRTTILALGTPVETGVFKGEAPATYVVLVPLVDSFPLNADDYPQTDVQEVRITLFSKNNYVAAKDAIVRALLAADFYITDRRYNGYETETGYFQYTIDVAKQYDL